MNVKGNHEFKITREQLWTYLMDPEVLAKITPGVSKLEVTGTDSYNTVSDIKIGPVKGAFKGKLNVADKNEPAAFIINMEQLSKIGNAHVKIAMNLEESENGNAKLSFDGNAKLSGMIARTGQRVLSGVANAITKEVFAALEAHIEENAARSEVTPIEAQSATSTATSSSPEKVVVEEKLVHQDQTKVIQSDIEPNSIEKSEFKEKPVVKESSASTQQTNSDGGFFSAIANFFKSIFGNK